MDQLIWSLTSAPAKRISGSKNFCSTHQKEFCNNILRKRTPICALSTCPAYLTHPGRGSSASGFASPVVHWHLCYPSRMLQCLRRNTSFVSFGGAYFGLALRFARCKLCDGPGGPIEQAINTEEPGNPAGRECSAGIPVVGEANNDVQVVAHSRRHLLFDNSARSERVPKGRQQAGGSGKAERADRLQTRWNGPRHKAMGW